MHKIEWLYILLDMIFHMKKMFLTSLKSSNHSKPSDQVNSHNNITSTSVDPDFTAEVAKIILE